MHQASSRCRVELAGPNKKRPIANKEDRWKELGPEAMDLVRRTVDDEHYLIAPHLSRALPGDDDQKFLPPAVAKQLWQDVLTSWEGFKQITEQGVIMWAPSAPANLGRLLSNFERHMHETGRHLRVVFVSLMDIMPGCTSVDIVRDLFSRPLQASERTVTPLPRA